MTMANPETRDPEAWRDQFMGLLQPGTRIGLAMTAMSRTDETPHWRTDTHLRGEASASPDAGHDAMSARV